VTSVEPASTGPWHRTFVLLLREYADAVSAAGAVPVLLPPTGDAAAAAAAVARLDGLMLTGGADVDPVRYGAERHPETQAPRTERDAYEIDAVAAAAEAGLPILAICRGLQVFNVARGGTLHQHLPDVVGADLHRGEPGVHVDVEVHTVPGSRVAGIVGAEVKVPCHHHQAIDRLGTGLVVAARAGDGTIEAVEDEAAHFVVAVQWHPEEGTDSRLFDAFVAAARRHREQRP
jgi:putative glutamine amidotransferase